jgi:hypothetical protein
MAIIVPINSRDHFRLGMFMQTDFLPGEDPAAFQQLLNDWVDEFQPAGVEETHLVHEIVIGIWLEQRYARLDSELLHRCVASGEDSGKCAALDKFDRRRNSARRQVATARKELRRIQSEDCIPEPKVLGL